MIKDPISVGDILWTTAPDIVSRAHPDDKRPRRPTRVIVQMTKDGEPVQCYGFDPGTGQPDASDESTYQVDRKQLYLDEVEALERYYDAIAAQVDDARARIHEMEKELNWAGNRRHQLLSGN